MSKVNSIRSTLKKDTWIKSFLKENRGLLVLVIFLGFMTAFSASALMFISGYLISKASTKPYNILLIYVPIVLTRAFGISRPAFRYIQRLTSHNWVLKMTSNLRLRLYNTIESSGVFFRDIFKSGDILSILTEDVGHIQNLYLRTIFPSFVAVAVYIFIIVSTGIIDFRLGIALFVLIGILISIGPLLSLSINGDRISDKKIYRNNLYRKITDSVLGVGDYFVSGQKEKFFSNVLGEEEKLGKLEMKMQSFSRKRNLVLQLIFMLVSISVIIFAGTYFSNFTNKNWIAAFVLCVFPLADTFIPLSNGIEELSSHERSIKNVNELSNNMIKREYRDLEKDISYYVDKTDIAIKIENLSFGYNIDESKKYNIKKITENEKNARTEIEKNARTEVEKNAKNNTENLTIKNINLDIRKNEKICILGKSGTGKTTLLRMLSGDLDNYSGSIKIFGEDMKNVDLGKNRVVGVLNQSPWIFNTTIYNNLKLANDNLTYEKANEIIKIVGLKEKIDSLEKGLDTVVDEGGGNFSGGEKQRMALCRILAMDTPIILLDEPTVGLDPVTEHEILYTIFKVFKDKTIVWVTHHLQDVEKMDRVVYLSDGKVIMDDTPKNLIENNEFFRMLYNIDKGL